jgi:hypothetical protein
MTSSVLLTEAVSKSKGFFSPLIRLDTIADTSIAFVVVAAATPEDAEVVVISQSLDE